MGGYGAAVLAVLIAASYPVATRAGVTGSFAPQDLILEDVHHAPEVAELRQKHGQLVHHAGVGGRQIVQLLQVFGCSLLVAELVAAQLHAAREELSHQGAVEHFGQRAADGALGAFHVAYFGPELFERIERFGVHVRDERVAQPLERLIGVAQIALRELRRAAQQESTRSTAVTRALSTAGERLGQGAAQRRAPLFAVPLVRG